jgi:TM2 domain-containing membrane protein YozV
VEQDFQFHDTNPWRGIMTICKTCHQQSNGVALPCTDCGAAQAGTRLKDQTLATLLAAFLGDFGIHRFYLGQPLVGLLYLAFFWTGVPGIIASLEAYRFAFMKQKDWSDHYNDGRPGKPVRRWVLIVLVIVPILIFMVLVAAIDAGYDF